jgi:hypothetical protein
VLVPATAHRHTEAMPLVSVVLIFLNEQRFLEEAVRSVRDQKLADWELISLTTGPPTEAR